MTPTQFAHAILLWYDANGRKDLPWRQHISAYRVWVSEIMLQQTQVQTVIPYFHRFMQRFPSLLDVARANEEEVLHLWTGLGYYARARHLHRTARCIQDQHHGKFPENSEALAKLPGIGRSTAGAILSIAMKQKAAILDANVKRVLSRFHAIEGWTGASDVSKQLWALAELYTPSKRVEEYTQAIMDLGATLCTRTQPKCQACPIKKGCKALATDKVNSLPSAKPGKSLPVRQVQWLILRDKSESILLEKRPALGIWGSLWSFPECPQGEDAISWCQAQFRCKARLIQPLPAFRHSFSHFHLEVTPVQLFISKWPNQVADSSNLQWYALKDSLEYGLPSPVKRLLLQFMRDADV